MIPHRMLSSEIYGSGLKGRVIACRKRLRLNRATHATIGNLGVNADVEELSPEPARSVAEFKGRPAGDHPERPAISTSVVRAEYRSPVSPVEAKETESMLLAGEQGVGIT